MSKNVSLILFHTFDYSALSLSGANHAKTSQYKFVSWNVFACFALLLLLLSVRLAFPDLLLFISSWKRLGYRKDPDRYQLPGNGLAHKSLNDFDSILKFWISHQKHKSLNDFDSILKFWISHHWNDENDRELTLAGTLDRLCSISGWGRTTTEYWSIARGKISFVWAAKCCI